MENFQVNLTPNKDILEQIFEGQKKLMQHYVKIESLPNFDEYQNLSTKKHQKLLKDFAYRITEELAEASEVAEEVYHAHNTNNLKEAQENVLKFNEEIADALHFHIELLIYSNIGIRELKDLTKELLFDNGIGNFYKDDNLTESIYDAASFYNLKHNNIKKSISNFISYSKQDTIENPLVMGFRQISNDYFNVYEKYTWSVIKKIMLGMNLLKNKDWKQADEDAIALNISKYQKDITESFLQFIFMCDLLDINRIGLYNIYFYKNSINHDRIAKGY